MADNVAITPGAGDTIAADDVGGAKYQRIKLAQGADGSATDVSSAAPLQVTLANTGANATAVKVDNSAVTQPVSGTITANIGTVGTLATAAKQDTGNTSLGTIAGAVAGSEMQVDVLTMPTTTVQATNLDIRDLTATDVVTANLSATDNAVLDDIAANQTDGTHKTQIVDSGGEAATVTGGKLDVNATASLAGETLPVAGATEAVAVAIVDSSGDQISSFGGGTQYTEGDVAADPVGTVVMWKLGDDSITSTSEATPLPVSLGVSSVNIAQETGGNLATLANTVDAGRVQVDVLTAPTTTVQATNLDIRDLSSASDSVTVAGTVTANAGTNLNTSTLLTTAAHDAAFGTAGSADTQVRSIQGIASMTPVQVSQATGTNLHAVIDSGTITTVSAVTAISNALPAGTNAIGKLAANSGVDIGDVDVTSLPGIVGTIADDSTTPGAPVMVGGMAKSPDGTDPGNVSAENDVARVYTDLNRRMLVNDEHPRWWSYHSDGSTALTDASVQADPGDGFQIVITDIIFSNGAATAINMFLEEGSTKILGPIYLEAINGRGFVWKGKKHVTASTAVTITTSSSTAHSVDILGYIQAV